MNFKIINKCHEDMTSMKGMLKSFLPFAKKTMGFTKPVTITFQSDGSNAQKLLGKTAHYDPTTNHVVIYVTGRHPKDVMRSLSHELVHHAQNCRGEFGNTPATTPGYAQKDNHLRRMEEEAYKVGNLCFRDWEDGVKTGNIKVSTMIKESLLKEETGMLKRGMGITGTRDKRVARMQSLLVQDMGNVLPTYGVDGRYGPETEQGVRRFQKKYDLGGTGVVDKKTLQKLEQLGNTKKADKDASETIAAFSAAGVSKNKRFSADPDYEGGLEEEMERVSPKELYRDLLNAGLNSDLSKALVANARAESNFFTGIAGDQGTYARVRFSNKSIPFNTKGPSCSLGLWQFNICGGLGVQFMEYLNLTHDDEDEKIYKAIANYENQIEFMARHLTSMTRIPQRASAKKYIAWLVKNVIRPADMDRAIRERKIHLDNLERAGVFEASLREWKNDELNRLLLEKFNLGVKK